MAFTRTLLLLTLLVSLSLARAARPLTNLALRSSNEGQSAAAGIEAFRAVAKLSDSELALAAASALNQHAGESLLEDDDVSVSFDGHNASYPIQSVGAIPGMDAFPVVSTLNDEALAAAAAVASTRFVEDSTAGDDATEGVSEDSVAVDEVEVSITRIGEEAQPIEGAEAFPSVLDLTDDQLAAAVAFIAQRPVETFVDGTEEAATAEADDYDEGVAAGPSKILDPSTDTASPEGSTAAASRAALAAAVERLVAQDVAAVADVESDPVDDARVVEGASVVYDTEGDMNLSSQADAGISVVAESTDSALQPAALLTFSSAERVFASVSKWLRPRSLS